MPKKPTTSTLSEFVNLHRESFVPFELWVSDGLSEHLARTKGLDETYTSAVVDSDEDEPISKVVDDVAQLRLNGRFYVPKFDKEGNALEVDSSEWVETAQEWFDENEVEVVFDEESVDLIKFTAFVGILEIPPSEESEGSDEGESGEDEEDSAAADPDSEPDEEPEEDPGGDDLTDSEPETDDSGDEDASDSDIDEFTKALGL